MIPVTKFNRSVLQINATLIESVESTPDTVITLMNGKKLIVLETVDEVLALIESFYRRIGLVAVQVQQNAEGPDVSE